MNDRRMLKISVLSVLVLLSATIITGCITKENLESSANKNNILMHVYVFKDTPESNYELRKGTFKKLDSIPLNRINETAFYGKKSVRRINGTLCVGYPSTNFIDGKACVRVDQSQNETNITVHYWKTDIAII